MRNDILRIINIKAPVDYSEKQLKRKAAAAAGIRESDILDIKLVKRSVDARNKQNVHYVITVDAVLRRQECGEGRFCFDPHSARRLSDEEEKGYMPALIKKSMTYGARSYSRPVVVGSGPAGLFAALILAQNGLKPLLLERGEPVKERTATVKLFMRTGILNTESNIQFGEGGAGTFSDGKLHTGIKDVRCGYVFKELVEAGAPAEILWQGRPHIGTDKLKNTVAGLREKIICLGGEFMFGACVADIVTENKKLKALKVRCGGAEAVIECDNAIFAVGHSARDTFEMLFRRGVKMEKKPFAVGLRIEHRRDMIDRSLYGNFAKSGSLGSAAYKLSCITGGGVGVYTFCMCPGGFVVPASSEDGRLTVNGMSEFARDAENSNSALLVGISPENVRGESPLAGIELQRRIEEKAFLLGGGGFKAPVQLVGDYMQKKPSLGIGGVMPSYVPGFTPAAIDECLPDFVSEAVREALPVFERSIEGFASYDAVLTGVESRSSSPVRMLRGEDGLSSIGGLFPCGEGAGYAGGITSSAVDGIKCAEKLIKLYYGA